MSTNIRLIKPYKAGSREMTIDASLEWEVSDLLSDAGFVRLGSPNHISTNKQYWEIINIQGNTLAVVLTRGVDEDLEIGTILHSPLRTKGANK